MKLSEEEPQSCIFGCRNKLLIKGCESVQMTWDGTHHTHSSERAGHGPFYEALFPQQLHSQDCVLCGFSLLWLPQLLQRGLESGSLENAFLTYVSVTWIK